MTRTSFITIAVIAICVIFAGNVRAHPPWSIAVDRSGQIYFSDLETIWRIDVQGKLSVLRAGVRGRHTHELTIDADGNLYGEDLRYEPATQRFISALWKITPAGDFEYILAPTDSPPKGMSIWKDRSGNMYSVAQPGGSREALILKRTTDGKIIALSGDSRAVDEVQPGVLYSDGMALAPDGSLYIRTGVDTRRVTMDGAITILPRSPVGFAVDAQGNIFGADYVDRRIIKRTPDGKETILLHTPSPWRPAGVALKDSALYVLELRLPFWGALDGARVLKRSSDGTVTVLAALREGKQVPAHISLADTDNWNAIRSERSTLYLIGAGIIALTVAVWYLYRVRFKPRKP